MAESRVILGSFAYVWELRKLSELADFSKGQGYTKSDLRESGTPIILYGRLYTKYQPIIREVDTFADVIPGAVFSKGGEVILPSSGETSEDIAIASSVDKSGFLLGGGLNVVFPHEELQSAFIAIELSYGTPHNALAKRAQGKSVVHLYNEDLKQVSISFPSTDEQAKISSFFDNIDNLITLHQRNPVFLFNLCLFREKIALFNQSDAAAPTWELRKLSEFVDFFSGLTYKPNDVQDMGTLVLRSSNVSNGEIVDADNVYVDSSVVNSDNVIEGDIIVVVRNGSRSLIGKHAQIKRFMPNTVIGAFMTGIRSQCPSFTNALLSEYVGAVRHRESAWLDTCVGEIGQLRRRD